MVYRYSWVAGIAAIGFALWRMSRLLEPTTEGVRWQLVLLAAVVVGAALTWAGVTYRLKAGWIALLNLVLFAVAAARYIAPDTGYWIFPGTDSLTPIASEISRGADIIRHGIEPVPAIAGLVVILAAVFWGLGALLVFGLLRERPFVGLIPPLVVGLQLLTIERQPSSNLEIAVFVLLVAGAALGVGLDEHDHGAGRMATPGQPSRRLRSPLSRSALVLVGFTVVVSLGVSSAMATRVPTDGIVTWRAPGSAVAGAYGSISYDPFVSIHDGLVSQEGLELFAVELSGEGIESEVVGPADVYYRFLTLDSFDGISWGTGDDDYVPAEEGRFEERSSVYAGPSARVSTDITIFRLRQFELPAPYAVRGVAGDDADGFEIRTSDASIGFPARSYRGMRYRIDADVPLTDSGAIARGPDGSLYPAFLLAELDGEAIPDPSAAVVRRALPDAERYLDLPEDLDPRIRRTAEALTGNLESDFAKGLALEYWFRENGDFSYSTDVDISQGHGSDATARWLFDRESPDYRTGYCEDFATSMGVMARAIGIPTRVVIGFLPGERVGENQRLIRDFAGHAWIELWIPEQGWMRFDPTPRGDYPGGLSPAARALSAQLGFDVAEYLDQAQSLDDSSDGPAPLFDEELRREPFAPDFPGAVTGPGGGGVLPVLLTGVLLLLAIAVPVLGGVPAVKWARRRARIRRLERGDVGAAWDVIVAQLADLDRPVHPAATPSEVADDVGVALQPLASVYTKSLYGPEALATAAELDDATRSMTQTEDRLLIDLPRSERVRATYRMASLFDRDKLSRWLPWLRP